MSITVAQLPLFISTENKTNFYCSHILLNCALITPLDTILMKAQQFQAQLIRKREQEQQRIQQTESKKWFAQFLNAAHLIP